MSTTTYMTHAEVSVLIALVLPSTDQRRVAFAALSDADKTVCCVRATRDFDACLWRGRVQDTTQLLMWPRYASPGDPVEMFAADSGPLPSGVPGSAWSYADLPHGFREAFSVQAGLHALQMSGGDYTTHLRELANRGVMASAGGETLSMVHALSPWARLCDDAQAWMEQFRRSTA